MKSKRRAISMGLAAVIAMTGLAGCGGNATDGAGTTEAIKAEQTEVQSTTKKEAESQEEKVTIHFATWIAEGQTDSINGFYEAVAKFNETYPNIEVILDLQPTNKADDFEQKYNLLLLGGDKTDIIENKSMEIYISRAEKGLFAPIDDYMTVDGTTMDEYRVSTKLDDGKIYGLPSDSVANLVLLNKDALEEAGLALPSADWTWDDYAEYAKKLTKEK